ncbi:MAG TPA: glycosyltransferase family 2 protein, partial [Terriglobia bacterium]|nr:glycosyltransferase family 2 protein [Terriglobia bacterium]
EGLMPSDPRLERFFEMVPLERGLIAGGASLLAGLFLLIVSINQWRLTDFGHLDYAHTMRLVIPGAALTALGFQTILSIFFLSILRMRRR